MGTELLASFLIVNYNSQNDINRLILEIESNFKGNYEILIFDNSSNLKIDNKKVKIFDLNKNIGFGAAHNYLSIKACTNYLFILNPDITITKSLSLALAKFKTLPISYAIFSLSKADKLHTTPFVDKFINNKKRFSSNAFIVGREYFKALGGFDPNYFMYFEDDDFALKLKQFDLKTYYSKNPYVTHNKNYNYFTGLKRKKYYYESFLYFLKKHSLLKYIVFFIPLKLLSKWL